MIVDAHEQYEEGQVVELQLSDGERIAAVVVFSMRCPFCESRQPVALLASADQRQLLHVKPYCQEFDDLDADEYLAAAKRASHAIPRA